MGTTPELTSRIFTKHTNWHGSFYELGIEYSPGSNEQQLLAAVQALWQHPLLEGPVVGPYAERSSALTQTTIPSVLENNSRLYGLLHLPQRRTIGCLSVVMCPGTDPIEVIAAHSPCWVLLCVPTGMLGLAYPIEYPIVSESNAWIDEFERILVDVAESVYRRVPFDLAVIGEEAATIKDLKEVPTAEDVAQGGYLISPRLAEQLKPKRVPISFPTGLLWFPWAS